jgi:spondin-1
VRCMIIFRAQSSAKDVPVYLLVCCVVRRATVIESENSWHRDDKGLTKVLCHHRESAGDRSAEASRKSECCACGTAKYLLTFRGVWPQRSRLSDSPTRHAVVHWSSVIGASHSYRYAMWNYGIPASRGVGDVCEYGDARQIEDEMHQHVSSSADAFISRSNIAKHRLC